MSARPPRFSFRRARPAPAAPSSAEADAPPQAEVAEVDGPERASPPPDMRRERRALARRREIDIRDVGGLAVEMVRRDRFRPELLIERAGHVLLVEQRIHELDSLLAAEAAVRGLRHVPHCKCGAPLPPGVHFCSHCGRAAVTTPPVLTCTHCGQALPADTNFCPSCGNAVAAEQFLTETGHQEALDTTMVRPAPAEPAEERSREQ